MNIGRVDLPPSLQNFLNQSYLYKTRDGVKNRSKNLLSPTELWEEVIKDLKNIRDYEHEIGEDSIEFYVDIEQVITLAKYNLISVGGR